MSPPSCLSSRWTLPPKGERILLGVCPVIHHVLWMDTMVFPHISPNSKVHIFFHACCLEMLGFLVIPCARPLANFEFCQLFLPLTSSLPGSLVCVYTPRAQHQRPAALPTASLPTKQAAHTQSHIHIHIPTRHWQRNLGQLLPCCPRARQVWKPTKGQVSAVWKEWHTSMICG